MDLTPFFTTRSQANDFATRVSVIAEQVYKNNFKLETVSIEILGVRKTDALTKLLNDNNVPVDQADKLKEFFADLLKTIHELPTLNLTIAFEPKEKTLLALSDWFMFNLKKQILLDITVDPLIIAGAQLKYRGHYIDGSSRTLFEKVVQEYLAAQAQKTQPQPNTEQNNAVKT